MDEDNVIVDIKDGSISYFTYFNKNLKNVLIYRTKDFAYHQEFKRESILAINRHHVIFKNDFCLTLNLFCKLNFNENIMKKDIEIILI